ncbi:hypothetical protein BS78_06G063800 [Paspalum vaginatum]|nr:hypothetical protein BS78_06G063800 [Paspalum vaginatum]
MHVTWDSQADGPTIVVNSSLWTRQKYSTWARSAGLERC